MGVMSRIRRKRDRSLSRAGSNSSRQASSIIERVAMIAGSVGVLLLSSCTDSAPVPNQKQSAQLGLAASGVTVGKETHDQWPFPEYAEGLLDCKPKTFGDVRRPLVIIQLGRKWYGLNGAAMGVGGYPDAREQMAKHPEWGTYELGATSELIEAGIRMCDD